MFTVAKVINVVRISARLLNAIINVVDDIAFKLPVIARAALIVQLAAFLSSLLALYAAIYAACVIAIMSSMSMLHLKRRAVMLVPEPKVNLRDCVTYLFERGAASGPIRVKFAIDVDFFLLFFRQFFKIVGVHAMRFEQIEAC